MATLAASTPSQTNQSISLEVWSADKLDQKTKIGYQKYILAITNWISKIASLKYIIIADSQKNLITGKSCQGKNWRKRKSTKINFQFPKDWVNSCHF